MTEHTPAILALPEALVTQTDLLLRERQQHRDALTAERKQHALDLVAVMSQVNSLKDDVGTWRESAARWQKRAEQLGTEAITHRDALAAQAQVVDGYAAAARVIGLHLDEFCDRSLPYDEMIAEASRRAAARLAAQAQEIADLKAENTRLRTALESIAHSSCCGCCQEAALVARAALATPEHQG